MATNNLEQTVKNMQREIERLQAVNEIQNLFSKLDCWHSTGMEEEAMTLFAMTMPDVSVEVANMGVYVGEASIRKMGGLDDSPLGDIRKPGSLGIHCRTSPIIEVAKDCKTAKGWWMSPGLETGNMGGKWEGTWCWCKYGVDFIKENGKWKIWHIHTYPIFKVDYYKSWIDTTPLTSLPLSGVFEALKPDKPTTYLYEYTKNRVYENIPAPPEPYETWDGKTMAAP
jgi:hypothetical protein